MAFEDLKDRRWVEGRLKEGLSSADIARLLGCSPALVCRWLKQHGIRSGRAELKDKLNDRSWLERVYAIEGRNAAQVAGLLGCERSAVHNALRRHGLPIKGRSEAQAVKAEHLGSRVPRPKAKFLDTLSNKVWLEACLAEGLSVSTIAKRAGCAPPSVSVALEKFGLEPNLPSLKTPFVPPRQYRTRRIRNPDARQRHWYRARRTTPLGPCVVCGRQGLDVNHKDRNPENNDPSNLERLCRRCHRRQEAAELVVMKARLESLGVPFLEVHAEAREALRKGFGP
jgi:DNA-binding CsgD family transcriptional regulator